MISLFARFAAGHAIWRIIRAVHVKPAQSELPGARWLRISQLLPWLVLVVGLAITYFIQQVALTAAHLVLQDQFAYQKREISLRIEQRLAAYEHILLGARGLFNASERIEREEFHDYVNNLQLAKHYPGIQGVGFSLIVLPQEKAGLVEAIRQQGFPEYTLRPEGERDLYTAIIYLEPFADRNLRAFGYDMYSEAVRRVAMEAARDLDTPAISGKVTLVQEAGQQVQAGFLMYLPVYRNGQPNETLAERRANIIGWVYSPFRMNDLMQGILGEQVDSIHLEIFDGKSATPETLMYNNRAGESDLPGASPPIFQAIQPLEIFGHAWTIRFASLPSFEAGIDTERVTVIRLSGLLISVLLAALVRLLTNARERAVSLASIAIERSVEAEKLRGSEERFRKLFDNNSSVMLLIDPDSGEIVDANSAAAAYYGYPQGQMVGMLISDINTLPPEQIAEERQRAVHEERNYFHFPHHLASGELRQVEVHSTPIQSDGRVLLFSIIHDITERQQAEEALASREALLKQILDTSSVAIFLVDRQGRITQANQCMAEMFGCSLDELVGHEYVALVHPAEREIARQKFLALLTSEIPSVDVDRLYWRADQSEFWGHLTGKRFHGASGVERGLIGVIADISARKKNEEKISELNRDFVAFLESTNDFIYFKDTNSRFRFCSQTLANITGHASWREMIGKHDLEVFPEETAKIYQEEELPIFRDHTPLLNKIDPYFDAAGNRGWVSTNKWPLLDHHGNFVGLFGISHDITESKKAEEQLQLAASVFTYAREGIMITDADGTIIDANNAFSRITSYSRDEVLGRNPRLLSSGRQEKEFYDAMWRDLVEKGHWYGEIWNRRKNGEVYAVMQTISAVRDAQGRIGQYVALLSDITALKEHEQQLEHLAHYDALTTLPNRVLLADRLRQGMAQAQRRGQMLAVAYLDLDGFKAINDTHGHEAGDQLLMTVANRMKQALREGDTLARLGGDEFVAVLVDLDDVASSVPMIDRLLAAAAQPVLIDTLLLKVSASLGVSFYPQTEDIDADQLLRQADQAMYQAKLAGRNRYHVFDAELDRSVRGHHESLERIRCALTAREFVLHYQPKVNVRTGAVIGAEALIRWQHPESGLLAPVVFLPVIEDHPLAVEIGEWVIDTALAQMSIWQAAGLHIPVSVNIGARQLQQADFVDRLRALLAAHPEINPGDLELEVLETSALEDLARVSGVIESCREIGINFALDDFGTGYSSLTYLKRLAVTQLKIDQSFVRDMLDDPDDLAILEGVLGLATAFRRQVIAEGVETVAHGEMLLQLGCELAQGFGIARPMPADELPAWAASWRPDPRWIDLPSVSHEDLPLLFASAEHRSWIGAVTGYLKGERDTLPSDHQHCRFGAWLNAEAPSRHGAQAAFQAIEPVHRQVHALAVELCELQASGRNSEALARLGELHALRDALLEQLKSLVQENRR